MSKLDGLTAERVSTELSLPRAHLDRLAHNASDSYESRSLDDGEKERQLRVPAPELKAFQSRFYRHYLRDHPFRDEVYCRPGRGVIEAAKQHRKRPYLLHLDISSFFPSVHCGYVRPALAEAGVDAGFVRMLTRLLTVDNQLPQGAPTSVAVGNLVLTELDRRVGNLCREHGLTYTRYVDDLTISAGGERLTGFEGSIRGIAEDCGWELGDKGGLLGPDEEHLVLGLVVGTELNVSTDFLHDVEVVLEQIEAEEFRPDEEHFQKLRGRISWIRAVQPEKGEALEERFAALTG